jgi:hypothetical protein
MGRDVDGVGLLVKPVEIVAKGLPLPVEAFVKDRSRDLFHAFHQLDEAVCLAGAERCKAHTAVAHHDRRHAVP